MKKGFLFFILCFLINYLSVAQIQLTGKIFSSGAIAIFGDVEMKNVEIQNPDGIIWISSNNDRNKIDISNSVINGVVEIGGNDHTTFNLIKNCMFGSLVLNKQNSSDLEIFGDSLIINQSLQLTNGRIKNEAANFKLCNTNPEGIQYNQNSYIIGEFNLKTKKDIEYSIPLGNEEDLYLLKLTDKTSEENNYKFCFCDGSPYGLKSTNTQLLNYGYWEITAQNNSSCDLTLFYKSMNLIFREKPSLLQILENETNAFQEIVITPTYFNINESWLSINAAVNHQASKLLIIEDSGEPSEWINFISLSSGIDTHYIIPELNSQYQEVQLYIYNNWGNKIFKSENYQNDFDASGYPEGTYYYQATYKQKNNENRVLKNGFFEIKN